MAANQVNGAAFIPPVDDLKVVDVEIMHSGELDSIVIHLADTSCLADVFDGDVQQLDAVREGGIPF